MELTEPWKSMNLPIDGAIVEASTFDSLLVHFPTVTAADLKPTHAALRQGLIEAGWIIDEDGEYATGPWSYVTAPDGRRGKLTSRLESGRPTSRIGLTP